MKTRDEVFKAAVLDDGTVTIEIGPGMMDRIAGGLGRIAESLFEQAGDLLGSVERGQAPESEADE